MKVDTKQFLTHAWLINRLKEIQHESRRSPPARMLLKPKNPTKGESKMLSPAVRQISQYFEIRSIVSKKISHIREQIKKQFGFEAQNLDVFLSLASEWKSSFDQANDKTLPLYLDACSELLSLDEENSYVKQ